MGIDSADHPLDLWLADFRWWRRRRGGIWYLLRDNMHPANIYWSSRNAVDGEFIEMVEVERYGEP